MKQLKHICLTAALLAALLTAVLPLPAAANSAEPPGFIVLVTLPPDSLALSLLPSQGGEAVPLVKEQRGWETYFRFFYHSAPQLSSLSGCSILVEGGGYAFSCPLPDTPLRYNSLLTLDLSAQTLSLNQPPWRAPLLAALRLILTLVLEGAVFWLFGYRARRSWLVFLAVNVLTQAGLNLAIHGPSLNSYWWLGFLVLEAFIFLLEAAAFALLLREFRRRRGVAFALAANTVSLAVGGLVIAHLPI